MAHLQRRRAWVDAPTMYTSPHFAGMSFGGFLAGLSSDRTGRRKRAMRRVVSLPPAWAP